MFVSLKRFFLLKGLSYFVVGVSAVGLIALLMFTSYSVGSVKNLPCSGQQAKPANCLSTGSASERDDIKPEYVNNNFGLKFSYPADYIVLNLNELDKRKETILQLMNVHSQTGPLIFKFSNPQKMSAAEWLNSHPEGIPPEFSKSKATISRKIAGVGAAGILEEGYKSSAAYAWANDDSLYFACILNYQQEQDAAARQVFDGLLDSLEFAAKPDFCYEKSDLDCSAKSLINLWPNKYDNGADDYTALTPATSCKHLLSIPFNNSKKILRVYLGSYSIQATKNDCPPEGLKLVIYNPDTGISKVVGSKNLAVWTGNSGGLFVPWAITRDDKNIILNAFMGSPGAGGSSMDYGFRKITLNPDLDENGIIKDAEISFVATRQSFFYDSYNKVVYIDEGQNTPHYSNPGPSNNGALIFYDIVDNKQRVLLEETDTGYELVSIDEKAGILKFKATKYIFDKDCPRGEDSLACAKKESTVERTIVLP